MRIQCRKRDPELERLKDGRCLDDVIAGLAIDDRSWFVLERRLGPGNGATLENVSRDVGVTRERVRQLQKKAVQAIYCNLDLLMPLLAKLDMGLDASWLTLDARENGDAFLRELESIASQGGWSHLDSDAMRTLVVALRALVDEHPEALQDLPTLSFAACVLDPPIRANSAVSQAVEHWEREERERRRNWTYDELAEHVLRQAGETLHWRTLAERAEALGRRISFSVQGFFNAVQSNDEIFARVGQGTYGLTEWGLVDVANYTDIVAEILSAHGRPLTGGAIYQQVNIQRSVDQGSLKMMLETNVRFYRSIDQTYGLRSWLPDRNRQTLRTPSWQVEDASSYRRVARSENRGYKTEAIVQRDRDRFPLL